MKLRNSARPYRAGAFASGLNARRQNLDGKIFPRAQVSIEAIRKEIEGRTLLRGKISTSVELPLAPETKECWRMRMRNPIDCSTATSGQSICCSDS
jgi:hypothetical protein